MHQLIFPLAWYASIRQTHRRLYVNQTYVHWWDDVYYLNILERYRNTIQISDSCHDMKWRSTGSSMLTRASHWQYTRYWWRSKRYPHSSRISFYFTNSALHTPVLPVVSLRTPLLSKMPDIHVDSITIRGLSLQVSIVKCVIFFTDSTFPMDSPAQPCFLNWRWYESWRC